MPAVYADVPRCEKPVTSCSSCACSCPEHRVAKAEHMKSLSPRPVKSRPTHMRPMMSQTCFIEASLVLLGGV
jgi:hypothetical protein